MRRLEVMAAYDSAITCLYLLDMCTHLVLRRRPVQCLCTVMIDGQMYSSKYGCSTANTSSSVIHSDTFR
jgi:hypothetical protein